MAGATSRCLPTTATPLRSVRDHGTFLPAACSRRATSRCATARQTQTSTLPTTAAPTASSATSCCPTPGRLVAATDLQFQSLPVPVAAGYALLGRLLRALRFQPARQGLFRL